VLSRADLTAISLTSVLAIPLIAAYLLDFVGLGLLPYFTTGLGLVTAIAIWSFWRKAPSSTTELVMFGSMFAATAAYLLWNAWPALLPTGSGPDLTHHLMLVDYIDQHQRLVRDPAAARKLGEMAAYTPGLHLLTSLTAAVTARDGLFTIYPVLAISVAIKFAVLTLIALRIADDVRLATPLLVATIALLLLAAPLTLDAFMRESYLAQVLSEMFAVVMLWALSLWSARPAASPMLVFGIAGAAAFLTWPVWVFPLLLALTLMLALRPQLDWRTRLAHGALAVTPIAIGGLLHSIGRVAAASIVGVSGAIPPSLGQLPWWPLTLVALGLAFCVRMPARRPLLFVLVGLLAQTLALLLIARRQQSATPYMAIKMSYFAIYPAILALLVVMITVSRRPWIAWVISIGLVTGAVSAHRRVERATPMVAATLHDAGLWARTHLPAHCIDYLVANEYTAYWLHLAVLRNDRFSDRSANNDLYLTEPSLARWVENRGTAPYAIARRSVLPADIRERTRVLYERGDALVIARLTPTPDVVDGSCVASQPAAGF
jgi:hypothetical protein